MKRTLIATLVLSIFLFSCGPSVEEFNTKLVGVNDALQSDMQNLNNGLDEAMKHNDFQAMGTAVKTTKEHLTIFTKSVTEAKEPRNGAPFKAAVVAYIKVIEQITDLYGELSLLPKNTPQQTIDGFVEEIDGLYAQEEEKMKAAISAQAQFAKENNLQLR